MLGGKKSLLWGMLLGWTLSVFAGDLPKPLMEAAKACRVDPRAVTLAVVDLTELRMPEGAPMPKVRPLLAVHADRAVSPASTAKLVTTLAGLELLGADWQWTTAFYADRRPDADGRVPGIYLKGGGDPTLVAEDFGLLVDRLAQSGVRHIEGDLVVDRSFFNIPKGDPSAFDGRGTRPYNQLPDAAVIGYRSLSFEFVPDELGKTARIVTLPPLAGLHVPSTILLKNGGCGDWKSEIGYRLTPTGNGELVVSFDGALPRACGARTFNVVSLDADDYLERLFRAYWLRDGRTWNGRLRGGTVPEAASCLAKRSSEPLSRVTVLVNKWSNNLIARHIFLSLAAHDAEVPTGLTPEVARAELEQWLGTKAVLPGEIFIDNGSGLSRDSRVTARAMVQLLAAGWLSPRMSEYMSSLPITGVDGTMRKRDEAPGRGHLKTGYLADVRSIGGYVYARNGHRYAVYASVHGEKNMPGGIRFLDKVIDWTYSLK